MKSVVSAIWAIAAISAIDDRALTPIDYTMGIGSPRWRWRPTRDTELLSATPGWADARVD